MSPAIGIFRGQAPFNVKWITSDREILKTVISHQVDRYDSSIKRDIKLKLALKKFQMKLNFETQFKIEFYTKVFWW